VSNTLTISEALRSASEQLQPFTSSARIDAEALLCFVLQRNTAHFAAWPEKVLSKNDALHFEQLILERSTGTPVAYLTGHREFWSLKLAVTADTLIPRPETETLIEFVLEECGNKKHCHLADLGTGSGAIAIAIASERPDWNITATDISQDALAVAQKNARAHHIKNISFTTSRWFDALADQSFDIIISNPPYIAEKDPHLSEGDVRFEPVNALASGELGMDDIEIITHSAKQHLNQQGWLILEHGFDQKQAVFDCMQSAGFVPIIQKNDLSNQPRMTAGFFATD
jgi:release factor glutamine methyltransferase